MVDEARDPFIFCVTASFPCRGILAICNLQRQATGRRAQQRAGLEPGPRRPAQQANQDDDKDAGQDNEKREGERRGPPTGGGDGEGRLKKDGDNENEEDE